MYVCVYRDINTRLSDMYLQSEVVVEQARIIRYTNPSIILYMAFNTSCSKGKSPCCCTCFLLFSFCYCATTAVCCVASHKV